MYGHAKIDRSEPICSEMQKLQVVQNDMMRIICGYKRSDHVNMSELYKEKRMMSVNQMCVYHILLEMFNVLNNNSSEQLKEKILSEREPSNYNLRSQERGDLRLPLKPKENCEGFSYSGSKVWNTLPVEIRSIKNAETFKTHVKNHIWEQVPFN